MPVKHRFARGFHKTADRADRKEWQRADCFLCKRLKPTALKVLHTRFGKASISFFSRYGHGKPSARHPSKQHGGGQLCILADMNYMNWCHTEILISSLFSRTAIHLGMNIMQCRAKFQRDTTHVSGWEEYTSRSHVRSNLCLVNSVAIKWKVVPTFS